MNCQVCGKEITTDADGARQILLLMVFKELDSYGENVGCCSWACCLKKTRECSDHAFVMLPSIYFNGKAEGQGAADFLALLKDE